MKKYPVREVGKSTLAIGGVAVLGIIFIFVSIPMMNWLRDLMRSEGWMEGSLGIFLGLVAFSLSLMPIAVAYVFMDNWYQKLTNEDSDD